MHWELTPDKFPINSVEVGVITQLFTLGVYVLVSLATCRRPFDMDRMLHRGRYAVPRCNDGPAAPATTSAAAPRNDMGAPRPMTNEEPVLPRQRGLARAGRAGNPAAAARVAGA